MENKVVGHARISLPFFGRLVGLLAILLAAMTSVADGPASRRSQARFEVRFMTEMIHHHAMAVAMASLCEGRTVHTNLQQLCDSISASQSAEIEQMHHWLQNWYGVQHEPEMTAREERQLEMLASLRGADFEIAFMTMMIRHHEIAISRATGCVTKAYHRQLIRLCESILATQAQEIETMQSWLCQWYDICE